MAGWAGTDVRPDPKPPRREKATQKQWEAIVEGFQGQGCVACGLPYEHLHHIAFRKADRGGDLVENLAPLCNSCHERFHRHGVGWERIAAHIRAYVLARASRHRYVLDRMGPELFERRYPCPPFLALGDLTRYHGPDIGLRETA